jgi:hypothetical protein
MMIICAWCGRALGKKPGAGDQVSHGICPDCRDIMLKDVSGDAGKNRKK